jgi:dual-specificity kinase
VHTDLKPENILLVSDDMTLTEDGVFIPSSCEVKFIDFGAAVYSYHIHPKIVCTRQYRPPEIILGNGWTFSTDLWSIGCIIAELRGGAIIFASYEDYEQLAIMEKLLGKIPAWMSHECLAEKRGYFDARTGRFNWPKLAKTRASRRFVHKASTLETLVPEPKLRDLIYKLLSFSPGRRLTPQDAIQILSNATAAATPVCVRKKIYRSLSQEPA